MITTIEIANQQKNIPINPARTIRKIKKVLTLLGVAQARLSIVFVTDRRMHAINKQYLNHDYPTDVLSFDLGEDPSTRVSKVKSLEGEIVVSATTARRNAKTYQTLPERELFLYIVHGILHLTGYDDHRPTDKKKMRDKEEELTRQIWNVNTKES